MSSLPGEQNNNNKIVVFFCFHSLELGDSTHLIDCVVLVYSSHTCLLYTCRHSHLTNAHPVLTVTLQCSHCYPGFRKSIESMKEMDGHAIIWLWFVIQRLMFGSQFFKKWSLMIDTRAMCLRCEINGHLLELIRSSVID